MKNKIISYAIGIILLLIGIFMSISLQNPHFYTSFSIGLLIITLKIYNSLAKKPLFHKWKPKQHLTFWISLIIINIIIDKIGIYLNYWNYPSYNSILDEILKYLFEWTAPLVYFMITLLIGFVIFKKTKTNNIIAFALSLLIFVTLLGFITEYLNHFTYSWQILSMPFSNYQINNYFIVFQTIGYWLMAVIPLIIYKFTEKIQ